MIFHHSCDRRDSCIRRKVSDTFHCPLQTEYSTLATVNQTNQILLQYVHKTVPFFLSLFTSSPSFFSTFALLVSLPSFLFSYFSLILNEQLLSVRQCSKNCEFNNAQVRQGCCSYRVHSLLKGINR